MAQDALGREITGDIIGYDPESGWPIYGQGFAGATYGVPGVPDGTPNYAALVPAGFSMTQEMKGINGANAPIIVDGNGRRWIAGGDQSEGIQGPGSYYYIPEDIAIQRAAASNKGGMVENFLNGPGPVMLLGGALGAYGAFGPSGFLGSGSGVSGGGGLTNLIGDAGSDTLGGAAGGYNPYNLTGPLTTGAEGGLVSGAADWGALTGPLTTGAAGGLTSLLEGLPPGATTAATTAAQALQGGNGPVQPGYNPLDPSTYGGTPGSSGGILDYLKGAFPNANIGSLLQGLGQGALGYFGAQEQNKALQDMQNQWLALGAPSRARYEESFQPGFSIWNDSATKDAATQAADVAARSYSAKAGNPFDNQTSQAGIYNNVLSGVALPQLNAYRSQNLTGGQLGTNIAGTAGLQQADNAGGGLNAIGYGLGTALNPQMNIQDLLKQFQGIGGGFGGYGLNAGGLR